MLQKVVRRIQRSQMLHNGDTVVVGVSGGADSMALLHVLAMLAPAFKLDLIIVHMNHRIRGAEADRDERFVMDTANRYGIPAVFRSADTLALRRMWGTSLEDAARRARYQFLGEVAVERQAARIAVGHHRRDQAETVMLNLLRGCGSTGLRGMEPVGADRLIRPLIDCTKEDIIAFLLQHRISWQIDSTNKDTRFRRNRIRAETLPHLKQSYNPRLEECLVQTAEICRSEDDYLSSVVEKILRDWCCDGEAQELRIRVNDLLSLHEAVQRRVVRAILKKVCPHGRGGAFVHVEAVRNLAHSRDPHGVIHLANRTVVRRSYGEMIFHRAEKRGQGRPAALAAAQFYYDVTIPGEVKVREASTLIRFSFLEKRTAMSICRRKNTTDVYFSYDAVEPPLALRSLRDGDRIQPLGMTGTKKLKNYFIDQKVPFLERRAIPLLADRRAVLWIAGHCISERVRVTADTMKIVKAEIV